MGILEFQQAAFRYVLNSAEDGNKAISVYSRDVMGDGSISSNCFLLLEFQSSNSPPSFLQQFFAFLNEEKFPENGWLVYNPMVEYRRQVSLLVGFFLLLD